MGSIIKVVGLDKRYGQLQVLQNLSLEVHKGEVVAIIGSSGSGKSTLLRCMAGLEEIQDGDIIINGRSIKSLKQGYYGVGMVFQSFNLFPHYTVGNNIMKPCMTVRKLPKDLAYQKAVALLEKVHLVDKFNEYPASLSGGQKQRVAIARALAMEPEIMLFDEPTSALDPELAHEVFATIKELAEEGMTMIIVTHQIEAIKHFATRIVFLHNGQIEADGTPDYILRECDNPHLQTFLRRVEFTDLSG